MGTSLLLQSLILQPRAPNRHRLSRVKPFMNVRNLSSSQSKGLRSPRTPVIVGVGEITDRPEKLSEALEPARLIRESILRADMDTGGNTLLTKVDSLDIANSITCRYEDLPGLVSWLTHMNPRRAVHGPLGGESPVRLLHEAAARIARGESDVSIVCGAEAGYSRYQATRAAVELPWPPADDRWLDVLATHSHPQAVALGVAQPSTVYPFFENAYLAAQRQTPAESIRESAALWSAYASVASQNDYAWIRRNYTPNEIATPSPANRMIAWPYPKLTMANPSVNQGAAVILTTLELAMEAGIAEDKLVYFCTGSSALDSTDYLARDRYDRSAAMEAVLEACLGEMMNAGRVVDLVELYSCFPCVPKMVRKAVETLKGEAPSVTGGLTFFGGPLNNYMTHAACEMVRRIRRDHRQTGLLYGQGEFVTKHHALVLGGEPLVQMQFSENHSVQLSADRRRTAVPKFAVTAEGEAHLETFTVLYDRNGEPRHGVAIVRTSDERRAIARVPRQDSSTLSVLLSTERSPVGAKGLLSLNTDQLLRWSVQNV